MPQTVTLYHWQSTSDRQYVAGSIMEFGSGEVDVVEVDFVERGTPMTTWSLVDPGLPTLPLVFDLSHVARLFAEHWPIESVGWVTILDCRQQDVYYQPGTRCVTTYALRVRHEGAAPQPTIGVIEVTPAGLSHRLYLDDPCMPQLRFAVCGDAMRERFSTLFEWNGGHPHQHKESVKACAITPIRYKPGSRCTLKYDLSTSAGLHHYFGKMLAHGSSQLMQVASALFRASQIIPEMPQIAQPLAYWPELHMGIQSGIAGVELHQCAFDVQVDVAERERWMYMAGGCLAALHNFMEVDGPRRTLEDDLSDLCGYLTPLEMATSTLATRFGRALEDIATSAQGRIEATLVASHGALRTDQFLIEQDRLVLIDLDSFCWANPARDIANFLAYLQWKAMRQPQHATFIERSERAFLAGYTTARAMPEKEWLVRYRAVALLKIVGRRFRSLTVQEWPMAGRLLDVALGMVNSDGNIWEASRV